jgi:uncharacterized protein (DUF433 family)
VRLCGLLGKDRAIIVPYNSEAWRERLNAPNYRVGEAARYARTSASNVARWHKDPSLRLPVKDVGAELSYVQLIEVAVVAACRRAGLKMNAIRETRDYMRQKLGVPHPFATKRFKTDGRNLVFDLAQIAPGEKEKLVNTNLGGQLEWNEILQSVMQEFDYDGDSDLAVKWHVGGIGSPIIIDPRISFGAPAVGGIATWLLKARYQAGEPIAETARDFGIKAADVKQALQFERVELSGAAAGRWAKRHSSSIGASERGSQN